MFTYELKNDLYAARNFNSRIETEGLLRVTGSQVTDSNALTLQKW